MERVEPMVLTVDDKEYKLEYSRESVVRINKLGFKASQLMDNLEEMIPKLFYGAFYMHHPSMKQKETDEILFEKLGGLKDEESGYLMELYLAPRQSMVREEERKNSRASVMIPKSQTEE